MSIEDEIICFDNDTQVGYYKKNQDGTIYAKSISGQEILLRSSDNAEKIAKIFLCTYEGHKTNIRKKSYDDMEGQLKMNLL